MDGRQIRTYYSTNIILAVLYSRISFLSPYHAFFFYRSKKTAHCLLNIILNCRCVVIDVKKNGNVRYIPERSRYSIIIFYAVLPICGHLRMPLSTGSPDLRFYGWSDNIPIAMGKSRVRGVAS